MLTARRLVPLVLALATLVAGPATADWRDDFKVLRVGVLAARSPGAVVARLEPFRAWLADRAGVPVELVPVTSYRALDELEANGAVQYAIDSATSYVTTAALCDCVEPLAAPLAFDGSPGFHAVLLVRADSAIATLADIKGARVALSGDDSVAGRLLPLAALATAGIADTDIAAQTYQSPEAAIAALLDSAADVAVGWSSMAGEAASGYSFGVLQRMVLDGRLSMADVRIVWQSDEVPFGPHTVRKDVPEELRSLLADALVALEGEEPDIVDRLDRNGLETGGFAPVEAADYAPVASLLSAPVADPAMSSK